MHSDISFGLPVNGLKRKEMKEVMLDVLSETGVKTLIFPTFTFSFCNHEDYDIQNSPTKMGMLPEFVRSTQDIIRTDDPILSVAIRGDSTGLERMNGRSSCGTGGIFHQLRNSGKDVKFLFFGTSVTKCFTYLHYVEEIKKVPYRYTKKFEGKVIDNGVVSDRSIDLFVRYKGVVPTLPENMESDYLKRGIELKVSIGNSWISSVKEDMAYQYISELIDKNKYIFSILPETGEFIEEYEYGNVTTM